MVAPMPMASAQPDYRIRGHALQRIRADTLGREPLCRHCAERGHVTVATQLDHIVPLSKGGRDAPENRQPLCDECHKAKTRDDLRG
jgi:5-methylcytosine-specific restriction protein A